MRPDIEQGAETLAAYMRKRAGEYGSPAAPHIVAAAYLWELTYSGDTIRSADVRTVLEAVNLARPADDGGFSERFLKGMIAARKTDSDVPGGVDVLNNL